MQSRRAILGLIAFAWAAPVRADVVPIEVLPRGTSRLTIDGVLGDWNRFTQLIAVDGRSQVVRGMPDWTGPDDASFAFALARDEQALYIAAEVHDEQVVRTPEHRADDDALVLSLAAPVRGRVIGYELVAFPGSPGNYAGAVRFRGSRSGPVPGAQLVEAPAAAGASGFRIEIAIPWQAIPEINAGISELRGRIAYQDCDREARAVAETLIATAPDSRSAADLPPAAGARATTTVDMLAQFVQARGLSGTPSLLDRSVNIAGDAALERVVVFPRYIVALGPGIAGGARHSYVTYPLQGPEDVREVVTRDVTGDGRHEVILRLRLPPEQGLAREVLYVYGAPGDTDQLSRIFVYELGRTQGPNTVTNRATYEPGGRIRVTFGAISGYTQGSYPRLVEPGTPPPLTPWSDHRVEVFRWNDAGLRFEIERTESNPEAPGRARVPFAFGPAAVPMGTSSQPDVGAVLRLFRQQHGLGTESAPNFSTQGDVAGDPTPEIVHVYGRNMVVAGTHFNNGRSFYSVELPANADGDVLGLNLGDVTGDARADVIVRIRRATHTQVRGQTLEVSKEFMLVYSIDEAHRGRVFAAEVSRSVGSDSITNVVHLPRPGRNDALVIDAGRVHGGWNQQSYPFRDAPAQGFAPILLPWEPRRSVTYRWNGTVLAPVP